MKKQFLTDALIVFGVVTLIVIAWLAALDDCDPESGVQCETVARD